MSRTTFLEELWSLREFGEFQGWHIRDCKGGYFSNINKYSLAIRGDTYYGLEENEFVPSGTKIRLCGQNLLPINDFAASLPITVDGITIDFDQSTQEIIFNGTNENQSNGDIYQFVLNQALDSHSYVVSITHTGGTKSGGKNAYFWCTSYDDTLSVKNWLRCLLGNSDTFSDWSSMGAGGNYVRINTVAFRCYGGSDNILSFDNYRVKIQIAVLDNLSVMPQWEPYIGNVITLPYGFDANTIWYPRTGDVYYESNYDYQETPLGVWVPRGIVNVVSESPIQSVHLAPYFSGALLCRR